MKKYKITGRLEGLYPNLEGDLVEIKKTKYAWFDWTMKIKVFIMRIFYDWVKVEEVQ